jgi:hypothetical protein
MAWQDKVIKQTPEVASVAGKLGRSDRHRSRAGRDDRDHDHAQAAGAVAAGHDQGKSSPSFPKS